MSGSWLDEPPYLVSTPYGPGMTNVAFQDNPRLNGRCLLWIYIHISNGEFLLFNDFSQLSNRFRCAPWTAFQNVEALGQISTKYDTNYRMRHYCKECMLNMLLILELTSYNYYSAPNNLSPNPKRFLVIKFNHDNVLFPPYTSNHAT